MTPRGQHSPEILWLHPIAEGGECGRLLAERDWSDSPLGSPQDWPQSLRTSLSIISMSAHPMFIAWGPELVFLYNDGYAPILGQKHPWAMGRRFQEIWSEIWPDIEPLVQRAFLGQPTWSEDLQLFMERSGYKEEVYFTFSYSPIRDESGGVGGMFCACTETTARVLSERRIRTLQRLGDTAVEAKTVAEARRLCLAALAGNRQDIPFAELRVAADASETRELLTVEDGSGVSLWGDAVRHALSLPIPLRTADAVPVSLLVGINPRRALDAPYEEFLDFVARSVATALTNARAFEEERQRAESLAELDRAKTTFFSNVSHELRTPLTLMLAPLEELISAGDPTLREQATVAHRNGLRLQKLVNGLLDFSRIEAGRVEACFEAVDLAALTTDLASSFRSAMDKAGLRFSVNCPTLTRPVNVDRDMWEKIVLNLLSNAFKYTLSGGVTVSLREEGTHAVLEIADTGSGISADELPKIFDRFHRVEGAQGRTQEGTGIGLALVSELVRLHGGTVHVASREGAGSTFAVRVPFEAGHLREQSLLPRRASTAVRAGVFADEAARWNTGLPEETLPAERTFAAGSVLVVDDNADMRNYLRRTLAAFYEVRVAGDGEEALALIRERKPDLVLSDIMMPRLDGLGLLRRLRNDTETATLPVIFVSARAGEEARLEGLHSGADDYLIKPFTRREVEARVRTHIEMGRTRRLAAERESRLRAEAEAVLESMTTAFLAVDRDWRVVGVNAECERLVGMPRVQMLGRTYQELFGAEAVEHYTYVAESGNAREFTHYNPGWRRWFKARATPRQGGGFNVFFEEITQRKITEDRLQEREQRLRAAGQAASVGTWRVDLRTGLDTRDAILNELLGLEARDTTQPIEDFISRIHPADRQRVKEAVDLAMAGRAEYSEECRIVLPDGTHRWILDQGRVLLDDDGEPQYLTGAAVDITALKRAEHELRESEARFRNMADNSPVMVWVTEADGYCSFLSKSWYQFTGQAIEESHGYGWINAVHPDDQAMTHRAFVEATERCGPFRVEYRLRRADGVYRWAIDAAAPRLGDRGEFLGFIGSVIDINERRAVEQALGESEERFRTIANHISQFAWEADAGGNIYWYNQRWYDYTGTTFEEMRGFGWQKVHHPEQVDRVTEYYRLCIENGQVWEDTFPLRSKTGEYRWFLSRALPIRDEHGQVLRWFGTNTDVTAQLQTERALRRANSDLEQFAYSASHDLQEPLRSVKIYSEMLVRRCSDQLDSEALRYLEFLRSGAARMEALIRDLLAYTQVTYMEAPPEKNDLNGALKTALASLSDAIAESGATIEAPVLPSLRVHTVHMHQLFQNLIGNAIKYRSGVAPLIRIHAEQTGSMWEFSAADNGIGIAPEYQQRIFGLFRRLHGAGKYSGTGIGLSICQRIVERYGGRIWVESQPGEGSTFFWTLPGS